MPRSGNESCRMTRDESVEGATKNSDRAQEMQRKYGANRVAEASPGKAQITEPTSLAAPGSRCWWGVPKAGTPTGSLAMAPTELVALLFAVSSSLRTTEWHFATAHWLRSAHRPCCKGCPAGSGLDQQARLGNMLEAGSLRASCIELASTEGISKRGPDVLLLFREAGEARIAQDDSAVARTLSPASGLVGPLYHASCTLPLRVIPRECIRRHTSFNIEQVCSHRSTPRKGAKFG